MLHDASFIDDPTRLLRLALYRSRLGFSIEPHTLELAHDAIAGGALQTVSGARIGAELRRLADEDDPVRCADWHCTSSASIRRWHRALACSDPPLARRALALLPEGGDRATLVLAAAGLDVPEPELSALLEPAGVPGPAAGRDRRGGRRRSRAGRGAIARPAEPSQIAAAVDGAAARGGRAGRARSDAEAAARSWLETLRFVELEIDGNDLLDAGVAPGPAVGGGLRAALYAKLDGRASGRDEELAEALRAANATG